MVMYLGGLFTNTKPSVNISALLEHFKTCSANCWQMLHLHDSCVSCMCNVQAVAHFIVIYIYIYSWAVVHSIVIYPWAMI